MYNSKFVKTATSLVVGNQLHTLRSPWHSLSVKLLGATLAFLVLLAIILALLVAYGFQQTQQNAEQQSINGLETQGRDALWALTEREGPLNTIYFDQPAVASKTAAAYLASISELDGQIALQDLTQHRDGHVSDMSPTRLGDLFIPNFLSTEQRATQRAVHISMMFDAVAPALLANNPQAVAIYYVSPEGILRYYPGNTLEGLVPADWDLTQEPWFAPTAPDANPDQQTTWSPLYPDDVGNGLMTTVCTPVYSENTFDGMVCLDVTLAQIVERLNEIQMTPNSYAFLTDAEGRLIAGPTNAVQHLTGYEAIPIPEDNQTIGLPLADPAIHEIVTTGADGIREVEMNGNSLLLALTTLPDLGWHLGVVAPVDEVTAQSDAVVAAIQDGTAGTTRSTIFAMGGFFIIALLGATFFFSTHVTNPIARLVAGTQSVARGNLETEIPVHFHDELGVLAQSFNQMTQELAVAREQTEEWYQSLEQMVEDRTVALHREMEERTRLQDEVVNQAQALVTMSTPLIPVSDRIIVMPLIGQLDSQRTEQILHTLLNGVQEQRAQVAILDITGVVVIDAFVAEVLINAAQAVRLLGASIILTGVRPEVAQTLVSLDADLSGIITCVTLQKGVEYATRSR